MGFSGKLGNWTLLLLAVLTGLSSCRAERLPSRGEHLPQPDLASASKGTAQLPAQGGRPILTLNPVDPSNPQGAFDPTAGVVRMEVRLIGDNNADGTVSFADVNGLVSTFGLPVDGSTVKQAHDFNGDGEVNFADVNLLVAAFGTSVTEIRRYQYDGPDFDPTTAPLLGSYPLSDVMDSAAQPTQSGYLPIAVPVDTSMGPHQEVFIAAGEVAGEPFLDPATPVPISLAPLGFNRQVVDASPVTGGTAGATLAVIDGRPAIAYYYNTGVPGDSIIQVRFAISSNPDGSGGWQIGTIFSSGSVGLVTSLAEVDGRPAVTFFNGTNPALHYALNSQADGQGSWTVVTVDQDPETAIGMTSDLTTVGGKPAVCYSVGSNSEIRAAVSTTADGLDSWNISTVDTAPSGVGIGGWCAIAEVEGRPAVAYTKGANLYFAINDQPDGTGTWQSYQLTSDLTAGPYLDMVVTADGRPAIAYQILTPPSLGYALSDLTDGSGSWQIITADDSGGNFEPVTGVAITLIGGRPAVSFWGAGPGDDITSGIRLARSSSSDGLTGWSGVAVDKQGQMYPRTSIAEVNGQVGIVYHKLQTGELWFALGQ